MSCNVRLDFPRSYIVYHFLFLFQLVLWPFTLPSPFHCKNSKDNSEWWISDVSQALIEWYFLQIKHCYCAILHNSVTSVYVNVLSLKMLKIEERIYNWCIGVTAKSHPKLHFPFPFFWKWSEAINRRLRRKRYLIFSKVPRRVLIWIVSSESLVSPSQQTPTIASPAKSIENSEKETKQPILKKEDVVSPMSQVSESSKVNKRIRIYWPNVRVHLVS